MNRSTRLHEAATTAVAELPDATTDDLLDAIAQQVGHLTNAEADALVGLIATIR
tara:strand:+ start:109 stop:270 length:162 start_codon:yes stop_codon:yes gene_type:complete